MPKSYRLLPLFLLAGCHRAPEATAPPAPSFRRVTLAAGTPVRLVLLDELASGGTAEETEVHLALAEPLDGLPAMSPATAVVSASRTEGTLGAVTNRPARLNLRLHTLKGPTSEDIALSADPKEAKDYELNRANTGRPEAAQKEPEEADVAVGVAVQGLVEKGESGGLNAKEVGDLARKLGMGETAKLADAGRLDEAQSLIRALRTGGTVAGFAGGGSAAAALELVSLAGDMGHRLGRALGGRNIRAYPGTTIQAYVLRETTIQAPLSPPGERGRGRGATLRASP